MRLGMFALLSTLLGCVEPAPARAPAAVSLHAYYLFCFSPAEISEYIPLIVTREPMEALVAAESATTPVVLITTYARDSIWSLERDVPLSTAELSPARRGLRLRDVEYRYQEIAPAEVLRLLENPMGSILIHRDFAHSVFDRTTMQELIAGFGRGNGR